MASGPNTSWQIDGEKVETVTDFIFLGSKVTADSDCSHEIKRHLLLGRKAMTNLDSILRSRHFFANKSPYSESYDCSSSHIWMWELDNEKGWAPKNWCLQTVSLEKTLESPLDSKAIKTVHPKGNQPWMFIGRTDAEAEAPVLWPPNARSQLTGKDPDAGKDWRWEKKGMTEDKMVRWHHRLIGYEFEQALEDGEGQGSLECCSAWRRKELGRTEWLNNWIRTLTFTLWKGELQVRHLFIYFFFYF